MAKSKYTTAEKALTAAMLTERIRQTLREIATSGPPTHNGVVCWSIVCLEHLRELLVEIQGEVVRSGNRRSDQGN